MNKPIELLVGMIGSGKSYYAKQRALNGALISNDDSIVTMLHGGEYGAYHKKFKTLYKLIENQIIHYGVATGVDVVIDRTSLNPQTRSRYISIAKSIDTEIVAVCFPIFSVEKHAKNRFNSDNRGYTYEKWLYVAKHHFSLYVPPSLDEGFSSIIYLNETESNDTT